MTDTTTHTHTWQRNAGARTTLRRWRLSDTVNATSFTSRDGAMESYLLVQSPGSLHFDDALTRLQRDYEYALSACGISLKSQVFSRIYLSDIANQYPLLTGSGLFERVKGGAISVIEQRPLAGTGPCLLSGFP